MERFASFDQVELAYTLAGSGPPALLLHGFGADFDKNWVRPGIAAAIVNAGRTVVGYDARGHGESDKPHEPAAYGTDAMVRDAQALLDLLGVDAVDVVGYSMGAIVSSRLAAADGAAPGHWCSEESAAEWAAPPTRTGVRGIAAALEARAGERDAEDAEARAFRRFTERGGNDLGALAAIQRAPSNGRTGILKAIAIPTLVVAGADDRLAGSPAELAARIKGATAQVVPGNHLSAVARPEFAAAIVEFLARVSPNA